MDAYPSPIYPMQPLSVARSCVFGAGAAPRGNYDTAAAFPDSTGDGGGRLSAAFAEGLGVAAPVFASPVTDPIDRFSGNHRPGRGLV